MTDDATGATPDAAGATPPNGTVTTNNTVSIPANGTTDGTNLSDDVLGAAGKAALDREREARRQAERDMKELRAKVKAFEEKDLPEAERKDNEIRELRATIERMESDRRDGQLREAVLSSATRLGYIDPEDGLHLLDRNAITYTDDGRPKNVDKLLTELLSAKPHLGGRPRQGGAWGGSDGGSNRPGTDMNREIRRAAGRSA
jgi:hypothetical protein